MESPAGPELPLLAACTNSTYIGAFTTVSNHRYFARTVPERKGPGPLACIVLFVHQRGIGIPEYEVS